MAFAWGTQVAVAGTARLIEQLRDGDTVLAAAVAGGGYAWTPQPVVFADGVPGGKPFTMIVVRFGKDKELIVTLNQLLMLANGKLRRADQLQLGNDQLVDAGNRPLEVQAIYVGQFEGGIADIAAHSMTWQGSIDDHLIETNGAVTGDFLLQVEQQAPRMQPHMAPPGPSIGSPAYEQAQMHRTARPPGAGLT